MEKITIDLGRTRKIHSKRESRLLSFPDGIERIITLPRRSWAIYDELADRWVYPGLYEDECFSMALEYGKPGELAFEEAVAYLFGLAIESGWAVFNEGLRGNANQN